MSIARAEPCITSAMTLAARTDEFSAWAHEAKLDLVIETVIPSGMVFEPIRTLQAASTKFPDWLKTPDSPEYGFLAPNHRKWRDRLCSKLQQSGSCYSFGHNWEADLPYAVLTIFQICHHHEVVRLSNRDGLGSKADMRFCIDTLIAYICEVDTDRLTYYFAKRTLRLPDCTTNRAKVATTMVDGAIAIRVVDFEPYLSNPDLQQAASTLVNRDTLVLELIHCVVGFKSLVNGENQMKMAMVSALHQKKVLGIRTQFVFGILQYNQDFVQVNAACWIVKKMKIYRIGRFSLHSPAALVQLYIILREIKQLANEYKEQIIRSGLALARPISDATLKSGWAPMNTSTAGESNSSELAGEDLIVQPGLSPVLASLGQWDTDDKIHSFFRSVGSYDFSSGDFQVDIS
ncbi:unnamed protein product [Rhizoctonia solani]|nr:unnamed protein product [Rhizoctonia solani]